MKESWIEFEYYPPKLGCKTSIWIIKTKLSKALIESYTIGLIKWHPAWRKYAFFPTESTIWEEDCLREISQFIEEETRKHKR